METVQKIKEFILRHKKIYLQYSQLCFSLFTCGNPWSKDQHTGRPYSSHTTPWSPSFFSLCSSKVNIAGAVCPLEGGAAGRLPPDVAAVKLVWRILDDLLAAEVHAPTLVWRLPVEACRRGPGGQPVRWPLPCSADRISYTTWCFFGLLDMTAPATCRCCSWRLLRASTSLPLGGLEAGWRSCWCEWWRAS